MDKQTRREQAKLQYERNKQYVGENIDRLSWEECAMFAKQQDTLYLISIGER